MRRTSRAIASALLAALITTALASAATVTQKAGIRVSVDGKLSPQTLPRRGTAPVSVSVSGKISAANGGLPPQLRTLAIEINSHGRIETKGLPVCPRDAIQPATTEKALAACRSALVGEGTFSAAVVLKGQDPYPSTGKLLVFNGKEHGHPVLFGQIYTAEPFANSFVITFEVARIHKGTYGTALTTTLPDALGSWGYVTGISMTLKRTYSHQGHSHSYLSAGCPAPKGLAKVGFPLARTSFAFEGGRRLSSVLRRSCRARG